MPGTFALALSVALTSTVAFGALTTFSAEDDRPARVEFAKDGTAFEDVLARAKRTGRLALLEFRSSSCRWCERLEREVLLQPPVAAALSGFVCARYDATLGEGLALAERYAVRGLPTMVVVDAEGRELERIEGFRTAQTLPLELRRIRSLADPGRRLRRWAP